MLIDEDAVNSFVITHTLTMLCGTPDEATHSPTSITVVIRWILKIFPHFSVITNCRRISGSVLLCLYAVASSSYVHVSLLFIFIPVGEVPTTIL